MTRACAGGALLTFLIVSGCAVQSGGGPYAGAIPRGLDRHRPVPEHNPLSAAKIDLGRRLFFDAGLSRDGTRACASCHVPERAFTDGRPVSVGVFGRIGRRNVPTLVNRAYGIAFFWDGRTSTLEEQVLRPIEDPLEMAMTRDEVVMKLDGRPEYRERFRRVFGRRPNIDDLARALASYVRTVLSGNAPFDAGRYGDGETLPPAAARGLALFRGKANCRACHVGPNFTDEQFHNTGVAWRDGALADEGRAAVTGVAAHRGAFKTPTLREVARTAPYMHDGSIGSLPQVLEFYDAGGRPNPNLDGAIHPLGLTSDERADLVTFLEHLSSNRMPAVRR